MAGIPDRIRYGVQKVTFEAGKQRRIVVVQAKIRSVRKEVTQALQRIGGIALDLYRAGYITQPELLQACEQATALQAQIADLERELQGIRAETYQPPAYGLPQVAPQRGAQGAQYGDICPNGHGQVPAGARFCPECGGPVIHVAPPAAGRRCPSCGMALAEEALFCPECGTPVSSPPAAPPPVIDQPFQAPTVPGNACPNCGTSLAPEAVFCPECGHRLAEAPEEPETALSELDQAPAQCPNCGASVPPEADFCPDCGQSIARAASPDLDSPPAPEDTPTMEPEDAELAAYCPNCGASLEPGATACPDCGQAVPQAAAPPPEPDVFLQTDDERAPSEDPEAAESSPRCSNCGMELGPDAVFCPECGERVREGDETV